MVYAGIDVHRKRSQVSLVDGDGKELLNRNVDNGSDAMLEILEDLEPGTPVAFEAAYGWGWLADLLEERELEAHLVHPSACKAIASARLKNDKVDARMLAHLLRTDLLPEAWIAPKEVRDLRVLLRHRASLVRVRTSLKNRIHAVLADEDSRWRGRSSGATKVSSGSPQRGFETCTDWWSMTAAACSTPWRFPSSGWRPTSTGWLRPTPEWRRSAT